MSKPLHLILGVACAVVGAVLAPVLTFCVGFLSCWVVTWVAGDQNYMNLMYVVWVLAILAMPAGFVGTAIALDRLMKRRAQQPQGMDAPRRFPVEDK
jgi:hypothetical protein